MLARWKKTLFKQSDSSPATATTAPVMNKKRSNNSTSTQAEDEVHPIDPSQKNHIGTISMNQKGIKKSRPRRNSLLAEYSLDKLNLHRVYNKNEDFVPIGDTVHQHPEPEHKQDLLIQYGKLLNEQYIDYNMLKTLSWKGIPEEYRGVVWRIILDYQSTNREIAESKLKQMREEYVSYVEMYFKNDTVRQNFSKQELNMIRVVETDVPRTQPMYPIYKAPIIQNLLKRILIIWGLRHPACGYVQGINEITTPFILVFLSSYIKLDASKNFPIPEGLDSVSEEAIHEVEADTYWCLSKILDKIQDNYTNGQPGIKSSLNKIAQVIASTDKGLSDHLRSEGVEYIQYAFRWILCLLIREFPLQQVFRIFDTYLADEKGFQVLHVYMCAALILKFSKKIKKMRFQEIIFFFQNLPTQNWSNEDIEMLLAEAFVYMNLYEQARGHIKQVQADPKW